MRNGMFDFNGDGKLDVYEQAAEMQFIDEVILAEEKEEDEFLIDPSQPQRSNGRPRGEIKGVSFMGKPMYDATKDSDGVKILKSLAVIALCIGAFALPIAADMDGLGISICAFASVGLSMLILKNT